MSNIRLNSSIKSPTYCRLIYSQIFITVLLSLLFLIKGQISAVSALLGGLVFFIPNLYFIKKAFSYSGARAISQIVNSFYKGEAIKLALTAVLFSIIFIFVKPLDVFALFLTFIIVLAINWLAPVLVRS